MKKELEPKEQLIAAIKAKIAEHSQDAPSTSELLGELLQPFGGTNQAIDTKHAKAELMPILLHLVAYDAFPLGYQEQDVRWAFSSALIFLEKLEKLQERHKLLFHIANLYAAENDHFGYQYDEPQLYAIYGLTPPTHYLEHGQNA